MIHITRSTSTLRLLETIACTEFPGDVEAINKLVGATESMLAGGPAYGRQTVEHACVELLTLVRKTQISRKCDLPTKLITVSILLDLYRELKDGLDCMPREGVEG